MTYKQDLYKNKQSYIDDLFLEYLVPIMKYIEHLALIEEYIQNIDAATSGKIDTKMKSYHRLRRKLVVIIKENTGPKSQWKVSIGSLFFI